jgi:predicted O-methyltransferase YrrM
MSFPEPAADLTDWIARLYERPELLRMGHNQRAADLNLGLGWIYYALARVIRPRRAVVIGSYRGFVPLLLGRGFHDNLEPGEVTLVDPSMVDDFWKDEDSVRDHFRFFGLENVRHFKMTTQEFVQTEDYRRLTEIGLLFIDGYHSEEQARFDYESFEGRLGVYGLTLFHDSMITRNSEIYGSDKAYQIRVKYLIDELAHDPGLQVFDLPFGTGLTLVRKLTSASPEPLLEGLQARPGSV